MALFVSLNYFLKWVFLQCKHCDVLDKFKQMLEDNFCILYGKMGKRDLETAIGEYSVKNMKKMKWKDKYKGRSIGVALIYLTWDMV